VVILDRRFGTIGPVYKGQKFFDHSTLCNIIEDCRSQIMYHFHFAKDTPSNVHSQKNISGSSKSNILGAQTPEKTKTKNFF